jgi:hypothetical protein
MPRVIIQLVKAHVQTRQHTNSEESTILKITIRQRVTVFKKKNTVVCFLLAVLLFDDLRESLFVAVHLR